MLRGTGVNSRVMFQRHDDGADEMLGRIKRSGPARMNELLDLTLDLPQLIGHRSIVFMLRSWCRKKSAHSQYYPQGG